MVQQTIASKKQDAIYLIERKLHDVTFYLNHRCFSDDPAYYSKQAAWAKVDAVALIEGYAHLRIAKKTLSASIDTIVGIDRWESLTDPRTPATEPEPETAEAIMDSEPFSDYQVTTAPRFVVEAIETTDTISWPPRKTTEYAVFDTRTPGYGETRFAGIVYIYGDQDKADLEAKRRNEGFAPGYEPDSRAQCENCLTPLLYRDEINRGTCPECERKRIEAKYANLPAISGGSHDHKPANKATSQKRDNERAARDLQREQYRIAAGDDAAKVASILTDLGFAVADTRECDDTPVTIWHDADGLATVKQTPYTVKFYNGRPARLRKTADAEFVFRVEHGWQKRGEFTGYVAGVAEAFAAWIAYDDTLGGYGYIDTADEDVIAVPTAPNNTPCHECGTMHYHPPMNPLRPELYECAKCHNLFCGLHCVETANDNGLECRSCHNTGEQSPATPQEVIADVTAAFDRGMITASEAAAEITGDLLTVTASGERKPVTVSHNGPWQYPAISGGSQEHDKMVFRYEADADTIARMKAERDRKDAEADAAVAQFEIDLKAQWSEIGDAISGGSPDHTPQTCADCGITSEDTDITPSVDGDRAPRCWECEARYSYSIDTGDDTDPDPIQYADECQLCENVAIGETGYCIEHMTCPLPKSTPEFATVNDAARFYGYDKMNTTPRLMCADCGTFPTDRDGGLCMQCTRKQNDFISGITSPEPTAPDSPESLAGVAVTGYEDCIINHSPENGTTIDGNTRPYKDIIKAHGFRWGRTITAWYLPNSRDQKPDPARINPVGEALKAAGARVTMNLDHTAPDPGTAQRERIAATVATLPPCEHDTPEALAAAILAAHPLSVERANAAHQWSSFSPEKRAAGHLADYAATIERAAAGLWPHATTPEQRAILAAKLDDFARMYNERYTAWLSALSRTASTMITGGSGFNHRRNAKALDIERRRCEELNEWTPAALKRIAKALEAARTPEQAADAAFNALRKEIDKDLATIEVIERGQTHYHKQAFTNSIAGRIQRAHKRGELDTVRRALAHLDAEQTRRGIKGITKRHSIWKLA